MVDAAEADGVSLNQFVGALLASAMRWRLSGDEAGGLEVQQGTDRVSAEEYKRIWRNVWG